MDILTVTPYGVAVALAALAAVLLLCAQYGRETARVHRGSDGPTAVILAKKGVDPLELALWCIPCALIGARLLYCLIRFDFYFIEMGPVSVLRTWEGGFLLYGAVLGALLAAGLLAKRRGASVSGTLDALAAPGMLVIAITRLFEGTTGEGVGTWLESEALCRLPFAVQNEFGEWQLAVFLMEALIAAVLFAVILRYRGAPGEKVMTALLLYACCQVCLESLRVDSCLKIGFVRVSQVLSAVVVLGVTVIRAYRVGGVRPALLRALVIGVCVGIVGGLEWALDKTPVSNVILYMVMIAACAVMGVCGMTAGKKR